MLSYYIGGAFALANYSERIKHFDFKVPVRIIIQNNQYASQTRLNSERLYEFTAGQICLRMMTKKPSSELNVSMFSPATRIGKNKVCKIDKYINKRD